MARIPRKELIDQTEVGLYHCVQRAVRRAWLCGQDPLTGKNFDHRKVWIRKRLEFLAGQFAIDICSLAIMSNHLHLVVRNRPDLAGQWTDQEVARRWWNLFPRRKNEDDSPAEPEPHELDMLMADPAALQERRQRLSSLSWFMRCLAEPIARQANREDGCTGRFWEGRYKCQRLLDDAAVLACSVYVDLNPIRAGMAETPETSEFTSAYERIQAQKESSAAPAASAAQGTPASGPAMPRDGWLSPRGTAKGDSAGAADSGRPGVEQGLSAAEAGAVSDVARLDRSPNAAGQAGPDPGRSYRPSWSGCSCRRRRGWTRS